MATRIVPMRPEVWAGVECAHVRVGGEVRDELSLTGHDRRPDDLDRLAELGVTAVRYPVLWGRGRGRGSTDWAWADDRLARLQRLGLRPVLGLLHHGSGPRGMSILDPRFPRAFARYAERVALRYPWVDGFLPINEPLTTARFAGLYGIWEPAATDQRVFARLLLAMAVAARDAARAIRRVRPAATIIQNEDAGRTVGTRALRSVVARDNERRWLTFDLLTGRLDREHPWWSELAVDRVATRALETLAAEPEPPDVLGVDYYITSDRYLDHRTDGYPEHARSGRGDLLFADVEQVRTRRALGDGFSRGLRDTWLRYRRPVALSEVQMAGTPSDQAAWWWQAWQAALAASNAGIPVHHVTAWSAFGAVGWATLLRNVDGGYEAGPYDIRSGTPQLTRLGRAVRAAARGRRRRSATPGWWTLRDRVIYPAHA